MNIENNLERVQKIIAESGLCSRRKAEILIEEGKVKVNNKTITIGDKANKYKDVISVNNKIIKIEKKVYYMLNKPKDYITTSDDLFGRKKVLDLFPTTPRIFAIGRLDKDATGILLLTNDGDFANQIMHPRYEIKKTYEVRLKEKPFNKDDLIQFKNGIILDKNLVKPHVKMIDDFNLEVTLHVGIHKVVKRIFKELGYYVKGLKRTKIGNLSLDVPVGSYRELTEEDFKKIFN